MQGRGGGAVSAPVAGCLAGPLQPYFGCLMPPRASVRGCLPGLLMGWVRTGEHGMQVQAVDATHASVVGI